MGLFLAGSGVLCGLIWLEGIRRNLGFIEGLELIFEHGMDGGWWERGNMEGGRERIIEGRMEGMGR